MDDLKKELIKLAAPHALAIVTKYVVPTASSLVKAKFVRAKSKKQIEDSIKHYLQNLYSDCCIVKTIAFAGQPRQLKDLYIPLTLLDISDQEVIVNDQSDIFENSSLVVILDAAGMGKSTVVKKLVLNNLVSGKRLPILYPLRTFSKDAKLERELFKIMGLPETTPREAFNTLPFAIYLDGLDEAPDDLASTIVTQISDFQKEFPSARILVSSRKQSEASDLLKYKYYKIKELTIDNASTLIKKYDNDGEISKSLIKEIKKSKFEGIKDYLRNPLYVSLLYCAFRHKPSLPQKMCLFYEQVYHALFDQHDLTKAANYRHTLRTNLDSHEFSLVLRRLAFVGLVDGFRVEYSKLDFENKIAGVAADIEHLKFKVTDFVRDATIAVPLFIEEGTSIRWAHKSLLEFFAAMFICYDTKSMGEEILLKLVESERASNYRHVLEMCADIHYTTFRDSVGRLALAKFVEYYETSYKITNKRISKDSAHRRRMVTFGCRSSVTIDIEFAIEALTNEAIKADGGTKDQNKHRKSATDGLKGVIEGFSKFCGTNGRDPRSDPQLNLTIGPGTGLLVYHEVSPERWLLSIVAQKEGYGIRASDIDKDPDLSRLEEIAKIYPKTRLINDSLEEIYNNPENFDCFTDILNTDKSIFFLNYENARDVLTNIDSKRGDKSLQDLYKTIGQKTKKT